VLSSDRGRDGEANLMESERAKMVLALVAGDDIY
jgi:hypothetical protein